MRPSRPKRLAALAGVAIAAGLLPAAGQHAEAPVPEEPRGQGRAGTDRDGYTGAGSCSGVACHGSLQPKTTGALLNEYTTWLLSKDLHSRAFTVLSGERSVRMWRALHPELAGDPVEGQPAKAARAAAECRVCHALPEDPARWAQRLPDPFDGVSCESCHGPAGAWLGEHYRKDWPAGGREAAVRAGRFSDMGDLVVRAETCVACHVGNARVAGQFVGHDLMAAGHPRLDFELAAFDRVIAHWRPTEKRRGEVVREWGIGLAVALREQARLIAAHAREGRLLEFSDLDCFSCHHALSSEGHPDGRVRWEPDWRQRRPAGPPDWPLRPGWPVMNPSYHVTLAPLARRVAPDRWKGIEEDLRRLAAGLGNPRREAEGLAEAGGRLVGALDGLIAEIGRSPALGSEETRLDLAREIASGQAVAWYGFPAAEQTADALETLAASRASGPGGAGLEAALRRLSLGAAEPATFDPRRFAEALAAVERLLK